MFEDQPILIVEDNFYIALDLSNAVQDCIGRVVGPVGSVAEALHIVDNIPIAAAVLGFHLPDGDASPVAAKLAGKGVPFVVHTETGLPAAFAELHGNVPVLQKPVDSKSVLTILHREIRGNGPVQMHIRLGISPKQV